MTKKYYFNFKINKTMDELINQTMAILASGANLLKTPVVNESVKALFSWLKEKLSKESTTKNIVSIENGKHTNETLIDLKSQLETLLKNSISIKNELTERIKKIEAVEKNELTKETIKQFYNAFSNGNYSPILQNSNNNTFNFNYPN